MVLALIVAQLVFITEPAQAAVVGTVTEVATVENTVNFVDKDTDEVQDVSNNATGGTFKLKFPGKTPTASLKYNADPTSASDVKEVQTLYNGASAGSFTITFSGQTTAAIAYNASAATVDAALEALSNIGVGGVTVTGTGILANPWTITFQFPQDVPQITTNDAGLTGVGSTIATTVQGNLSVETALEALPNIVNVSVTGTGTLPTPWRVTFHYPAGVKTMQAVDSLTGGSGVTTISVITNGVSAPIDPSGIVYLGSDTFLVADSEIDEEQTVFDDVNLWEIDSLGNIDANRLGIDDAPGAPKEPTGLAYNPSNKHVYITNDQSSARWVQDVNPGGDGIYGTGDDTSTFLSLTAAPLSITDPEDVTWDQHGGQIWIAGGISGTLTSVKPGPNGVFDGLAPGGDDVLGTILDLSATVGDMEGVGYRAVSRTLVVTDATHPERLFEFTKQGRLVRAIDINAFSLIPSDLDFAPPSSGGGSDHIYLVDRQVDNNSANTGNLRDGKMFELSVPFENLSPFVNAGPDQVINFGAAASLAGDSYDDGQPTPTSLTFQWTKMSGPGTVTFGDSTKLATTATFSQAGVYELKLTASDGASTPSSDTLFVTMSPDPNQAPTANAGPDQTITLPSAANLSGTANDDGMPNPPGVLTTTWEPQLGPGTVTFGNASALNTTATFSEPGVYVLKLTANDSSKQHSDTVTITVNPAPPNASIVGGVEQSSGIWSLFDGGVLTDSFYFGNPSDFPFYGDWDCDGDETPGLYRQSDGYVYLRNSNTQGIADISFFFGNPGDVPIAGDFDGDGCDTVSIYRPSEAKFYVINELGSADKGLGAADYSFFYGVVGDVPFVGDWTGDGIDTPGLRRNSDGFVYLRNSNTQGIADVSYFYGNPGDVVFTGDWDGDGDDTLGLYRPSNGLVYLRNTNSTGIADMQFPIGGGMYPVAGDQ